jgi:DNA-binding CsgD family transcriptional regulator/tetratricopeptide (TPR) repeat protein
MPYPHQLDAADYGDYDAIRLFVSTTQRVQPDFSLEDQKEGVIKICQLVEGLPLAIELAAPWMKAMAAEEIVYEIHRNISILSTRLRNLPERHQSMVAIFEQSWSYLSSRQRNVFAALSVFKGGFQLEAAEEITGALSQTIMELVDKSLLRLSSESRFSIHELLRQHVERQLRRSPEEYLAARNLHCGFYADYVGQFQNDMFRDRHLEAMAQLEEDIENVRTAWDWAVAQLRLEEIQKISQGLYDLEDIKGRYIEGDSLINNVIEPLEAVSDSSQIAAVLSQIYLIRSWHSIRRGELELARDYAEKSQESLVKHDLSPPPGFATDPLSALGVAANSLGNYEQAEEFGEKALERAESLGESLKLQLALYVLSNAAFYQGRCQEARDFALNAKAIALELGSRWFMAYILDDLGRIDQVMGDYKSAKDNFRTTYKIRQDFDDPEGMALALNHLAQIALLEEDYHQAKQLFEQSRWLYLDIGDRGGLASSLSGLARTARLRDNLESAGNYLAEALNITSEMGFIPLTLELLVESGELLLTENIPEQGILLLTGVCFQPSASHEIQEKAQQLLDSNRDRLQPDSFKAITRQGKGSNLDQLLAAAKTDLADFNMAQELASGAEPVIKSNDQLIFESLTDRELEVLGLMSEGLSNPEIAERLIIAVGTVKSYTNQIYSKLGVRNRVEAVTKARDLGLLSS